jgi:exodeoxyribonuclease VIII
MAGIELDPRLRIYAIEHPEVLGWYLDVPNATYHKSPGVSKTSLDKIHKSPNHWLNSEYVEKDHLTFGSGVHAAVMEPNLWTQEFKRATTNDRRSKEWMAEKTAAVQAGFTLLQPDAYDEVELVRDLVMEHPFGKEVFTNGRAIAEGSLWVEEPNTGILTRVRPDWLMLDEGLVVDIKTTKDASPGDPGGGGGFPRSIGQFRYDVQAALYSDCLTEYFGKSFDFLFFAIESAPPYGMAVYRVDPDDIDRARYQYLQDMARLIDFVENQTYNGGYPTGVLTVEVPKYFKRG